eukprot:scaffold30759_cov36-Prasinocladus_malaysianus.AAC.2
MVYEPSVTASFFSSFCEAGWSCLAWASGTPVTDLTLRLVLRESSSGCGCRSSGSSDETASQGSLRGLRSYCGRC